MIGGMVTWIEHKLTRAEALVTRLEQRVVDAFQRLRDLRSRLASADDAEKPYIQLLVLSSCWGRNPIDAADVCVWAPFTDESSTTVRFTLAAVVPVVDGVAAVPIPDRVPADASTDDGDGYVYGRAQILRAQYAPLAVVLDPGLGSPRTVELRPDVTHLGWADPASPFQHVAFPGCATDPRTDPELPASVSGPAVGWRRPRAGVDVPVYAGPGASADVPTIVDGGDGPFYAGKNVGITLTGYEIGAHATAYALGIESIAPSGVVQGFQEGDRHGSLRAVLFAPESYTPATVRAVADAHGGLTSPTLVGGGRGVWTQAGSFPAPTSGTNRRAGTFLLIGTEGTATGASCIDPGNAYTPGQTVTAVVSEWQRVVYPPYGTARNLVNAPPAFGLSYSCRNGFETGVTSFSVTGATIAGDSGRWLEAPSIGVLDAGYGGGANYLYEGLVDVNFGGGCGGVGIDLGAKIHGAMGDAGTPQVLTGTIASDLGTLAIGSPEGFANRLSPGAASVGWYYDSGHSSLSGTTGGGVGGGGGPADPGGGEGGTGGTTGGTAGPTIAARAAGYRQYAVSWQKLGLAVLNAVVSGGTITGQIVDPGLGYDADLTVVRGSGRVTFHADPDPPHGYTTFTVDAAGSGLSNGTFPVSVPEPRGAIYGLSLWRAAVPAGGGASISGLAWANACKALSAVAAANSVAGASVVTVAPSSWTAGPFTALFDFTGTASNDLFEGKSATMGYGADS